MLHDIIKARDVGDNRLFLRFDDDTAGILDIAALTRFDGIFAALQEPNCFAQVRVDRELGTVVWPGGADLCPDVLYAALTGQPLPGLRQNAIASRAAPRHA
jgi:hypothetical protein